MNWLQEYKNSLKMAEVEEVIDLILYRPLAFLLVISIYNTKIKPDHLTLAALVMGIVAGIGYSMGSESSSIIGAIMYLSFNILDCSDGQLARIKKNGSAVGRLLDGIADYIAAIAVYAGIAIGFSGKSDHPALMVIMILITGVSIVIQESLVDYFRTRFLDIVLRRESTFNEGIDEYRKEYEKIRNQGGRWFDRSIVFIYLKYSQLQRNLTLRKKDANIYKADPGEYFKKNRLIIRFWVLMGPSAKITTLILCSLFLRFDIFFWIVIAGFNILTLILGIIQHRIDKTFEI